MINNQELLFIVDENNQPLKPRLRSFAHKNKLWHRTSGIWVINKNKKVLCQKRSLKKDTNPGLWEAFFGGHLAPGEEYLHNAVQELNEELGLNLSEDNLIPYKILKSDKPNHKEFQGIYALILNQNQFNFEEDEIDQLKWVSLDEIKNILVVRKEANWIKKPWDKEVLKWLKTL